MVGVDTIPKRTFGKTGARVPVIGLGTGPAGMGLDDERASELYNAAIDAGITYIDTSPGYGSAHAQLKPVVESRRGEIFLATKAYTATGSELRSILEQGLEDLGTDRFDLFYLHSMGQHDWDAVTAADGAIHALFKAKEEGLASHVGFTAHNRPDQCLRAVEQYPFDAVMLAMNFVDRHTYGFETKVLPAAARRGLGIAAMKAFGGAAEMEYSKPVASCFGAHNVTRLDLALRYCLLLPSVATTVVGVYSEAELTQLIEWIGQIEPFTDEEALWIEDVGTRLSKEIGAHFGEVT